MAEQLTVTNAYLEKFPSPLWDLMDFTCCQAMTATEGKRGAFSFVVLDIQHSDYKADAGHKIISTFFIIKIPGKYKDRKINHSPEGYDVSADSDYVYLVSPREKVRPGKWEYMIQKTIDVTESLNDEPRKDISTNHLPGRTYQIVDGGALRYRVQSVVFLFLGVVTMAFCLGGIVGLIEIEDSWSASAKYGLQGLPISAFLFWAAKNSQKRAQKRM